MEDLDQIWEGEAGGDRVDADGAFFDVMGQGLVEGFADERSCFGFAVWCDGVFKVVGHAVSGQSAGFVEELLG